MGHHRKRHDRETRYTSDSNSQGNIDMSNLSSLVNNPDISNLLNNVDVNQLLSQLSSNMGRGDSSSSIPSLTGESPAVNLLNSLRPFVSEQRHGFIDDLIKAFAIKTMIENSKGSRN